LTVLCECCSIEEIIEKGEEMQISESDKKIMMKTARSSGAVGKGAILPNFIASIPALKQHTILDFGCGKKAIHVEMLREKGYQFVYGYDLSPVENPNYTVSDLKGIPWHLVYASNVLNVQPSFTALQCTICRIADLARFGVVYLSYPKTPRKLGLSVEEMQNILSPFFNYTSNFKLKNTVIFKCSGKQCELMLEKGLTSLQDKP